MYQSVKEILQMATVTSRAKNYRQPAKGFLDPAKLHLHHFDDKQSLHDYKTENVRAFIVGLAVDYLSRYVLHGDIHSAFEIANFFRKK